MKARVRPTALLWSLNGVFVVIEPCVDVWSTPSRWRRNKFLFVVGEVSLILLLRRKMGLVVFLAREICPEVRWWWWLLACEKNPILFAAIVRSINRSRSAGLLIHVPPIELTPLVSIPWLPDSILSASGHFEGRKLRQRSCKSHWKK